MALRDISDDGRLVVYAVREGGVDEVSIRLREVDTGEDLPDVLPAARYGQVALARRTAAASTTSATATSRRG